MGNLNAAIKEQCRKSIVRYKEKLSRFKWTERGILLSEGLAFCAISELFEIDAIIESGIYNGRSTQIWAEYFPLAKIISIDQKLRKEAIDRLKCYGNVRLVQGNSMFIIPEQLEELNKNRIAIFIDGPKGFRALSLAEKCLKFSNISFIAIHDMKKAERARAVMESWDCPLFFTDEDWFIRTYSWLDKNESNWNEGKERKWKPYKVLYDYGKSVLELGSYGPTIGFVFNE